MEIHIFSNDSHVSRFTQADIVTSDLIMDKVRPDRIFTPHNLIVRSGISLFVFPCQKISRVDFVLPLHPDWKFHHNIIQAIQISGEEFNEQFAKYSAVTTTVNGVSYGRETDDTFAEFTLCNAEKVYAKFITRGGEITAADSSISLQHMFDAQSQYLERMGGGAILINTANIQRLRMFPGPSRVPTVWHAEYTGLD